MFLDNRQEDKKLQTVYLKYLSYLQYLHEKDCTIIHFLDWALTLLWSIFCKWYIEFDFQNSKISWNLSFIYYILICISSSKTGIEANFLTSLIWHEWFTVYNLLQLFAYPIVFTSLESYCWKIKHCIYVYTHYLYVCSDLFQLVCILAKLVRSHTPSWTLCILTLSVWLLLNTFLEKNAINTIYTPKL